MKRSAQAAIAIAVSTILLSPAESPAQGFNRVAPPSVRVQTDAITRAVRDALRLARNAKLVIKPGQAKRVNALTVNSSARIMITALEDGTARLWDLQTGIEKRKIGRHRGAITTVSVNGNGSVLATGGADGVVRVWRLPAGAEVARFDADPAGISAVALDRLGRTLFSAGPTGRVSVWDVAGKRRRGNLVGHRGAVTALALAPETGVLASGGEDGTVRLWDVATGSEIGHFAGQGSSLVALNVAARGDLVVGLNKQSEVRVWNREPAREIALIPNDGSRVLSVAVDDRGRFVATGGEDGTVRLFDVRTGREERNFVGHSGAVRSIEFEPTNRFLHSASADGTSRIWDLPSGREIARVISTNAGWTVVNAAGQYDGSVAGIGSVEFQTSAGNFDLDQFFEDRFEPGLLGRTLEPGNRPVRSLTDLSRGFSLPPRAEIVPHDRATASAGNRLDFSVVVSDAGGGLGPVRVYHNGKSIVSGTFGVELIMDQTERDRRTIRYRVPLIAGENSFEAIAANANGVESRPASLTVTHDAGKKPAVLHLLTVGIDKYRNAALDLNFGVADAKSLSRFYSSARHVPVGQARIHELLDERATRSAVMERLRALRETSPEDLVVILFAGHGVSSDGEWYFLPHDVVSPGRVDELRRRGISSASLVREIAKMAARNVLVLIDACKSGTALHAFRQIEDLKSIRRMSRAGGVHVIASTGNEQIALETSVLGHGIFTQAVLSALRGEADGAPRDGRVSVFELAGFSARAVPEMALAWGGAAQQPLIFHNGRDFTLTGKATGDP